MAFDPKKFLDQAGVGHLWSQVVSKVEASVAAEKSRAEGEEAKLSTGVGEAKAAAATAQAAADAADAKAVAAQGEVDALETYVGTFTASEGVDTVVKYIDAKTENIASDETVNALADRVEQAEKDIDAIEADYLKAADKEELQGNIDTLTGVVETLRDGVDAEKVDGVKDLIDYVEEHGAEVTGMKGDISANATAIEGLDGRVDVLEAIDHTLFAEKTQVATDIATAKGEAVDAAAADAKTKADTAEQNAKDYADGLAGNYATAAQGAKADTALQSADITTGTVNGAIAVKGVDVAVKGLGSAAFTESSAYDAAGSAQAVYDAMVALTNTEIDNIINGVNA